VKPSSRRLPSWVAAVIVGPLLVASGCAPAVQGAAAAAGPTDAEIVAIARAINQGEVVTNQPAVQRAQTAAVRQFAERMVADHTAANERLLALGITPQENQLSRQLTQSAQQTTQVLQQYPEATFGQAHMDSQVELHRYALNTFDNYLIPSSRSGRLRTLLQEMRTTVAAHLEQARQVRGSL
jgi:putative membrane protein